MLIPIVVCTTLALFFYKLGSFSKKSETKEVVFEKDEWVKLDENNPPDGVVLVACDTTDCGWTIDSAWWSKEINGWRISGSNEDGKAHLLYTHWRKQPPYPNQKIEEFDKNKRKTFRLVKKTIGNSICYEIEENIGYLNFDLWETVTLDLISSCGEVKKEMVFDDYKTAKECFDAYQKREKPKQIKVEVIEEF